MALLEHRCHCGRWGAFGFGWSARLELPGTWLCMEHKGQGGNIVLTEEDWKKGVPARFIAKCEFCPYQLDIRQQGVHQWTSGWVKVRNAGGGHGISLPVREARWAHDHCIDREIKKKGRPEQAKFL